MRSLTYQKQVDGFTILEIAIVLTVVSYLLKQLVVPFGARYEQSLRVKTQAQLESIVEAAIGFAAANHRLPCPASDSSMGSEVTNCTGDLGSGYVPSVTLGLTGTVDATGRLLDSWGSPIRYSVSSSDNADHGQTGAPDFTSTGEMKAVGMRYLRSELVVCREVGASNCPQQKMVANQLPLVVVSSGKDAGTESYQGENQDGDKIFVDRSYSQNPDQPFDDIVVWLSENRLFYQLIQAGVLP